MALFHTGMHFSSTWPSLMDDHCSWTWTGRQAETSRGLAGAFSGEEDYDPPSCLLAPQLSLSQGLQEAAEILRFFFSPFLKVWLKIKGVLKPSPAQKAECVGVMQTNTWGCEASWGSWHPSGRNVLSFYSLLLWHLVNEHTRC